MTPAGYAEKVRSQFLSLRQLGRSHRFSARENWQLTPLFAAISDLNSGPLIGRIRPFFSEWLISLQSLWTLRIRYGWRAKVRADVKSIAGTNRGYPRIYFVTNQFVPAKDSAKQQDELTKLYDIPVTILDRTWLLACVLEKDSLDVATKTLGVGSKREATVLGPRDHERQTKLDKIEKDIVDGRQYQGAPPTLAEDALRAAELTRGLEKPRYETDGRYERAVRIAREHRLPTHELKAVYGWAWTSYFWFDDATKLNALYADVERLALTSDNADDLERLNNLLPLLINAVAHEVLTDINLTVQQHGSPNPSGTGGHR